MPAATSLPDEVAARIEVGDCWWWTGPTKDNGRGWRYGIFQLDGRAGRQEYAHRLVWRLLVGPPPRLLHHQCQNTLCVNPDHLMPSTAADHPGAAVDRKRKQTTCLKGHPLEWVGQGKNRHRFCRTCHNQRRRR